MTRTSAIVTPLLLVGLLGLIAAGLAIGRPAQAQEAAGGPPCSTPDADDPFEENDLMGGAAPLKLPFSETDLIICPDDDDWFAIALAEGRTVSIDASFTHASGNVDMTLHDPSGAEVSSATSTSDNESIDYTPSESGVHTLGLELVNDPDGQGNVYQLDIDIDCAAAAAVGDAFASTLIAPLPIPDHTTTGVTDCMEIAPDGVISGLAVDLDIEHTWVGDLMITLEHIDSGTEVVLIDRVGFPAAAFGCSGTNMEVRLIDSADAAAEDSCINGDDPDKTGLSGTFRPEESLAAFNGQSVAGTWRLQVFDPVEGDSGAVISWALESTGEAVGDVNDDGMVNAVDAALILQLNAGLISSLPNEPAADVNQDGAVNAVDAALILQFGAGLVPSLPPP